MSLTILFKLFVLVDSFYHHSYYKHAFYVIYFLIYYLALCISETPDYLFKVQHAITFHNFDFNPVSKVIRICLSSFKHSSKSSPLYKLSCSSSSAYHIAKFLYFCSSYSGSLFIY